MMDEEIEAKNCISYFFCLHLKSFVRRFDDVYRLARDYLLYGRRVKCNLSFAIRYVF
jgi:hypothetical protein